MATNATILTSSANVTAGTLPTLAADVTEGEASFASAPDAGAVKFTISDEARAWVDVVTFMSDADADRGETLQSADPILIVARPIIESTDGGNPADGDWVFIVPPLAYGKEVNGDITIVYSGLVGVVDVTNPLRPIYQMQTGDVGSATVIATVSDGVANTKMATSAAITVEA